MDSWPGSGSRSMLHPASGDLTPFLGRILQVTYPNRKDLQQGEGRGNIWSSPNSRLESSRKTFTSYSISATFRIKKKKKIKPNSLSLWQRVKMVTFVLRKLIKSNFEKWSRQFLVASPAFIPPSLPAPVFFSSPLFFLFSAVGLEWD